MYYTQSAIVARQRSVNRVPTILLTKIQEFSRTFQHPTKNFTGADKCLNIKTNGTYLQYSECSLLQKIEHE